MTITMIVFCWTVLIIGLVMMCAGAMQWGRHEDKAVYGPRTCALGIVIMGLALGTISGLSFLSPTAATTAMWAGGVIGMGLTTIGLMMVMRFGSEPTEAVEETEN